MSRRPSILVSSCLLGEKVRYNGRDKYDPLVARLGNYFSLIPLCPEVESGLGIPREPMVWVGDKILGQESLKDYTPVLKNFLDPFLKKLPSFYGAVLKSRSPSCGKQSVPLWSQDAEKKLIPTHTRVSGLLVRYLETHLPHVVVVSEEELRKNGLSFFVSKVFESFKKKGRVPKESMV